MNIEYEEPGSYCSALDKLNFIVVSPAFND